MKRKNTLRVAELFAGVGGFRLGLEAASSAFETVFSSQWEPPGSLRRQFASHCYVQNFGSTGHSNEDIEKVLDRFEAEEFNIEAIDCLVGGFPCQDYSVAKPLNQSEGLEGKKGVLWWQIHRMLRLLGQRTRLPEWVVLENVDRLLGSPANQRGRDFAIMLASLSDLGYDVEWRVINAAEYGFPQRRRRVFIVGRRRRIDRVDGFTQLRSAGLLAKAFPVSHEVTHVNSFCLTGDLAALTSEFGRNLARSPFRNAGFVQGRDVLTLHVTPAYSGPSTTLRDVLDSESDRDESLFIDPASEAKWRSAKGSKNEPRTHRSSGVTYFYKEGELPFPDNLDRAARTILTSEGGASPSRTKHVIMSANGRYRRLSPRELERLNGFSGKHTATGMTDRQRAFCMGNALVVGVVERIARQIALASGCQVNDT